MKFASFPALLALGALLPVVACSSAEPEAEPAAEPGRVGGPNTPLEGTGVGTNTGNTGNTGNTNADAGPTSTPDSGSKPDASTQPEAAPPAGCGAFTGHADYACSADGNSRGKCVQNTADVEQCPRGCLRSDTQQDECMGTTASFSCPGSYSKTKASNGDYYITAFGCWIDANGGAHGDSGDNCIPTCLDKAKTEGLCDPGDTGKECEERVTWFTADGARFGCLARLRITNPDNGKTVIAVALDYGPACWVENSVNKAVLDASGRVDRYLFGSDLGASDQGLVHVVEVDKSTPLGPVP